MRVITPVLGRVLQPPGKARGSSWSPALLFSSGAQGTWFDPADFSTLYQDSAGTTPVTATGQPVGKILDKSGRGNHATQATATSRPTLQQDASGYYYLNFDGVDDNLATASIDLTLTDKVTAIAGLLKNSDATLGMAVEFSASSNANGGTFNIQAPAGTASATYAFVSKGVAGITATTAATYAAPNSAVLTGIGDISGNVTKIRVNGADAATNATSQGGGTFSAQPLYIGRRGGTSLQFNGRIYGLVVVGAAQSAANITLAERFIGQRMGIAL